MNAPFCPISRNQRPSDPRGLATKLPSIPIATDLPSLIRSVNIMRDILRSLTTSLTVNNTYLPRQPAPLPNKLYLMSSYPDWRQEKTEIVEGFVFHKSQKEGNDEDQRAYISRTNAVEFRQPFIDNDKAFFWRYMKALDSESGDSNDVPPFEEDFFERVINVNFPNLGTEIKRGGEVVCTDAGVPDPTTIMISGVVRITRKTADAAAAAGDEIPIFMFGQKSKKSKRTKHPGPKTVYPDDQMVYISFVFQGFHWLHGYHVYVSTSGPSGSTGPEDHFFSGGFYPSWDFTAGSPEAKFTDDKPINVTVGTTPSGSVAAGSVSPTGWTYDVPGKPSIPLTTTFKDSGWYGGDSMEFQVTAWWRYSAAPIQVPLDPYDYEMPGKHHSSLYVYPGDVGYIWLDVYGRQVDSGDREGDQYYDGEGCDGFLFDKWNHFLISGEVGSSKWSLAMNGVPAGEYDFGDNPLFTAIALSGLEMGFPSIPSSKEIDEPDERPKPNYDVAYYDFRVWFGGSYTNVTEPDTIAMFVDQDMKLVDPKKSNDKFGMPEVYMNKGAKSFIKNKGSGGTFNATGFSGGKEGLIVNWKPAPKFIGEKDTSKRKAN